MATRKDSRGYSLKKGESQRKDGRYVFRYTTLRGEHRSVYAKELSELRKKEVKSAEQSRMALTLIVPSVSR